METFKFLFDGDRVTMEQSPYLLEMSDGDVIDVVANQIGGM